MPRSGTLPNGLSLTPLGKEGEEPLIDETSELPSNIYLLPLSLIRLQYNKKAN
jgi:hypothetical protein